MPYRVAVLTVSDTASADASADKSGPLIVEQLTQHAQGSTFTIKETAVVPDDEGRIKATLITWSGSGEIDWILTTGGTGFGLRDKTPEAVKSLVEREAPGIVHLLLSASLKHTPLAALSRPVAGTFYNTLIVTLPGSPKAVHENMTALLESGILPHALELLQGGSGQKLHSELVRSETKANSPTDKHSHRHHHHDHGHQIPVPKTKQVEDASFPASTRNRISPYPLISYEQAIEAIMRETPLLGVQKLPVHPRLKGYILAEDVFARHEIPRTRTTNVDGYALRSSDPPGVYRVLTPRTLKQGKVPTGNVFRINTGAPLPDGTDSVIMVEDTQLVSTMPQDPSEENEVRTLTTVTAGENVRAPGSDVRYGEMVLSVNTMLSGTGGEIGTLAFVGRKEVSVRKKPVVAIMSTGNELVDIGSPEKQAKYNATSLNEDWTGIWDTNRPTLHSALETLGYSVLDLGIVHDDMQAHVDRIQDGLNRADIVLSTGGTSMGASDLLKPVIEKHLKGNVHFGRVTIKPGKPTTFATVPITDVVTGQGILKPIFGLPGNPASALVCFYIFVVPALRKMGGWNEAECQLPRVRVQLTGNMRLDTRTEFHRVIVVSTSEGLKARSTGGQRSSRATSLSGANGLLVLPQKTEGSKGELKAGEYADAIMIGEIHMT